MPMAAVLPMLHPNAELMLEHLEHLFGGFLDGYQDGLVELAWTSTQPDPETGKYSLAHSQLFAIDRFDDLVAEAVRLNSQPMCNVYIGAWLRSPFTAPFGRTRDADAWAMTAAYVDLDDAPATAAAKDIYGDLKPTWITMTGVHPHRRAQLWWRLEEPVEDHIRGRALIQGLSQALDGDLQIVNPGRVMRLAGSLAWATKEGRQLELTSRVPLKVPGQPTYPAEQLERRFPAVGARETGIDTGAERVTATNGLGLSDKIIDGREKYMRDTILAVMVQFIGENGAAPTAQELFDAAWPQYEGKTDLTRAGRGKDELAEKCRYTIRRFEEGRLGGLETLDKAVEVYQRKQGARIEAKSAAQTSPAQPAAPDDIGAFQASSLAGTPPPREWVVFEWIPANTVTSIYGDGGVGKTLIAQQLLYAAGVGGKWLGLQVPKCRALGVFCEDDKDELHRRHDTIKHSMGISIGNPFSDVWLWPRVGFDNLLVTFDRDSKPTMSPLFERTMTTVLEHKIGLLILDTAADLFGGNEVIRGQVNYFIKSVCGSYVRRAREAGSSLTVVILAHPSQAGRNSGTGESGSTGWSNAVRSRLYLTKPEDGLPEQRVLTRKKSNYAAAGDDVKLDLMWHEGAIVRQGDAEKGDQDVAVKSAVNQILRKVHDAFERGRPYGANAGYDNFIGKRIVAEMPHMNRPVIASALDFIRQKQMIISDKTSSGDRRGYRLTDDVKQELSL